MDGNSLIQWIGFHTGPGVQIARACAFLAVVAAAPLPGHAFVGSLEGFPAPMGSAFLRWDDLTDGETGFQIERKPAGGEFEAVVITPPNAIHYTDTGLAPSTVFTYRVRAVSTGQELPWREVEVETLAQWDGLQADPVLQGMEEGTARFEFTGEGVTYVLEETSDLSAWASLGDPFHLDFFETGEVSLAVDSSPAFVRVRSEAFERPAGIGLSMPFEIPPEPDGEVWDVTDFGASPISTTNDDAVGIKVAISLAQPGDVVLIPEGTYTLRQVLEVPTGVTLRGAGIGKTIFETEGIDRVVSILPEVHDVRIEGFTIRYLGDAEELAYGVYVGSSRQGRNSYRILIDGIRVERFSVHGVSLRDCHHVLVQNCEFADATNVGGGGHGYGVALNYPTNHNNWIRNNTIGPVIRHAILIQYYAHNNLVEYNLAFENTEDAYDLHGEDEYANELRFNIARDGDRDGFGVGNTGSTHDRSGPNNWIHHNTVENSLAGIEVIQASDMVFIDHNTFSGNEYGIRVHNLGGSHLYLRGNRIEDNDVGVFLNNARWVWLLHNHISGSTEFGLEILSGVENLVEEGNTYTGNAQDRGP
jgi:nitrous oxidase accessory protein NosD